MLPTPSYLAAVVFPVSRQRLRRRARAVLLPMLVLTGLVQAQEAPDNTRWVSDDLATYVRSGPTTEYRIVGTLQSGQKVELLGTQGDYSRVRSENGETVWIRSSELQTTPSHAERVPQLEQLVTELSSQLETGDQRWETRVQDLEDTLASRGELIDQLQAERQALNAELGEVQASLRSAEARLDDENHDLLMRYLVYGGSIAGAGLLVGLLLPALLRGRRKRDDRWF